MDYIIAFLGLGSALIFLILLIIGIISLIMKKSWAKKVMTYSLVPLIVFVACIVVERNSGSISSDEDKALVQEPEIVIDFNEFTFEVEQTLYNKEDNVLDILVSTNIPNGTEVNVSFNKMWKEEDGIKEHQDPILTKLKAEDRQATVENEKIALTYDNSDVKSTFINGEYGLSIDFEVNSLKNERLFKALGTKSEFEQKLKSPLAINSDETDYTVLLGQKMLYIDNSVSYQSLKDHFKSSAKEMRFAELDKNPDKHKGEFVKYQGEIIQIMENSESTEIRLAVTKDSYGYNYNDVIYITYSGTTSFVKEDIITVYGTIKGSHTYESQAGYQITLPLMEAEIIE